LGQAWGIVYFCTKFILMKFKFRLAYYLFGFMLGGFALVFIFNQRGQSFCYLPNCRVLKNIRSKGLYLSDEAKKTFNEGWATPKDVEMTLEYGTVDFDKSNKPVKGGKLYTIEGKNTKGEDIIIEVVNGDNKATLLNVKKM
jgi:hypothetical protein